MSRCSVLLVSVIPLAMLGMGCGSSPTLVEQFKLDQEGVVTSHGRIDYSSVEEMPDGQIKYRTTDGQIWRVSRTVSSNGSRNYGIPVAIPQDDATQTLVDRSPIAKKEGQQAGRSQPVVP